MPNLKINDVDLYYETHGEGPPLMLIAGLGSDSQSWLPIIKSLSRRFKVIILDNRGVGRTKPAEIETSIEKMSEDCLALTRHLGLSPVNLLGHSMGGFIALDFAIRFPEHLSKLILAGASAFNPPRNNKLLQDWASYLDMEMDLNLWFRNMFYWIFSNRFFNDLDLVNHAVKLAMTYPFPQNKTAFRNQVEGVSRFNCLDHLPSITAKTLVLCGKEDILFPPELITQQLKAIPDVVFSVIEDAAHSIHMEQPKPFTKHVLSFLEHT